MFEYCIWSKNDEGQRNGQMRSCAFEIHGLGKFFSAQFQNAYIGNKAAHPPVLPLSVFGETIKVLRSRNSKL